ncbi:hypothetical protein ACHAWF_010041 [Thalassiosira exigua]
MALDSSDLQQRRRASASRTENRNGASGSTSSARPTRRRRRKPEPNRSGLTLALLFSVITIVTVFVFVNGVQRRTGSGTSSLSSRVRSKSRSLQEWKPKTEQSAVDESKATDKAKQRAERYDSLYRPKFDKESLGYDIYDCPFEPPQDYPRTWKTTEVLGNWNPTDVTTLPPARRDVYQGLCVFDHQTQYATALNYRNAEKPFVIRNDPKVNAVVSRWEDDPEYLHRVLGDVEEYRTERSPNNQFMWYRLRGKQAPQGYQQPLNDEIEMTFGEWFEHALEKDGKALGDNDLIARSNALKERRLSLMKEDEDGEDDPLGNDEEGGGEREEDSEESKEKKFYYFRVNADLKKAREASPSKFIYDELPFFDPRKRKDSEFYMVEPKKERGINCRFGMRGVTAANHFDMSRNTIALFGGERRYVLGSPSQCKNMALHPKGHPSLRHSSVDWTNSQDWDNHPEFKDALINEVVLRAGDVLYLPTCWFHYIVNLSLNFQCNARSGTTYENAHFIDECGFIFH